MTVKAESGNILAGWKSALLAYENEAALADCYARLTADACETVLARSSHIVSTVTVDEEKALMLTMPQEKGWRVRIDGEPAQLQTALGFFPAVTLTPGTHQVEFRFVPPGLVYGLVCAGLALLAMLLWALWDKRRALNRNRHAVIGRANQEQIELHFQ